LEGPAHLLVGGRRRRRKRDAGEVRWWERKKPLRVFEVRM
jgi:hypothetical protein